MIQLIIFLVITNLELVTQVQALDSTNQTCTNSLTCPTNSFCFNGECLCEFGFQTNSTLDCVKHLCFFNPEDTCPKKFGRFADCLYQVDGIVVRNCTCDHPHFNSTSQLCDIPGLGSDCWQDDDCGENAICGNYACKCKMGYLPSADGINCTPLDCHSGSACDFYFPNSQCNVGKQRCECNEGYELDHHTQECILIANRLCTVAQDCREPNAFCNYGYCECRFGYIEESVASTYRCKLHTCNYDYECYREFPNSHCDYGMQRCLCDSDAPLDPVRQKCALKDKPVEVPATSQRIGVWIVIAIIGFILIVTCISVFYKCSHKPKSQIPQTQANISVVNSSRPQIRQISPTSASSNAIGMRPLAGISRGERRITPLAPTRLDLYSDAYFNARHTANGRQAAPSAPPELETPTSPGPPTYDSLFDANQPHAIKDAST